MRLLLLNSFKGLKKKKIQMFSIILLVALATGIYVAMNSSLDRLEDEYYEYIENQNTEHVSFDVPVDVLNDITKEDIEDINKYLKNLNENESLIMNSYFKLVENDALDKIDYQLQNTVYALLIKTDAIKVVEEKKLKILQKKYDFTYEYQPSKTLTIGNITTKIIPYNKKKKINIPYLIEGKFPNKKNEITVLPAFAKNNNLKIGDNYKINDQKYKIVGYAYAPDYIYPMVSYSSPIFDEKKNNIIFTYEEDYKMIMGIEDNTYSLVYGNNYPRKFEFTIELSDTDSKKETDDVMVQMFENGDISINANTVIRIARIGAMQLEFAVHRKFATYLLYLLLSVSVFIILVITKKRIDDERLQIGVLKALGYNRFSIALSYLVYPIIGSIIGGLLGYILGSLFNYPLTSLFLNYFNVPLGNYHINIEYLKTSIFVPMIMLSILSYIIAIIMLNKRPLSLLKEGSNLKVNIFSKITNKITSFLPFDYRFKYSLASRSLGKLIIVFLTSFATGLLIVLILISYNLFDHMIDSSFSNIDYKKLVVLNTMYEDDNIYKNQDLVLGIDATLNKITREDKKIDAKKDDEDIKISLTGLDEKTNYIDIYNSKEESILNKLESNKIIINKNLKEQLGLEINDKLTLTINGVDIEYEIVDISLEAMDYIGYVNRRNLIEQLNLNSGSYNQVYSNSKKYDDLSLLDEDERSKIAFILDTEELKENIMNQMDTYNASIYIIIFFASLMSFIIIAVIANIVVEENKKTISLLKVMGYKDRKISNIVLNIYTPFVIIAYLLSIPAMKKLLEWIISLLVDDMNMTIPITLSKSMTLLGLIGLLSAYYIAIYMSKKVLNKVPLAVALKRE